MGKFEGAGFDKIIFLIDQMAGIITIPAVFLGTVHQTNSTNYCFYILKKPLMKL
jgi:hypothetical protein